MKKVVLTIAALLCFGLAVFSTRKSHAFAYVFANESNGVDIVTHPSGYNGAGGVLNVSVGVDPTSANAAAMAVSVQNVINTFNNLVATTGNLQTANVPVGAFDFESVLLHELGHSLGLAHPNLASESGLSGAATNYTKTTDGPDDDAAPGSPHDDYDLNAGADGVIGSADDVRGDDVNLNWFKTADNNPFTLPGSGIIDSSTYSRDIANLPGSDLFSANGGRDVAALLPGVPANTEAVLQQGTSPGEAQRTLAADDVAGIRYAAAGLDEEQGTPDDYTLNLVNVGQTTSADIVIDFDNAVSFAAASTGGTFLSADHIAVTTALIRFNEGFNWFFNDVSNDTASGGAVPEPTSLTIFGLGCLMMAGGVAYRRRKKKRPQAQ